MNQGPMAFDAAQVSAIAVPAKEEMILKLIANDGDPDFHAVMPARAVGPLIVELRSELAKMPVNFPGDALQPMTLTGALPMWGQDNRPVLLLQLDGVVDLAVLIRPETIRELRRVLDALAAGPSDPPTRAN